MRVLLVRLDGVGDAAVCTPLVAGLRGAGHTVGVASTTRNAGLFSARAIEAEHVLERFAWPAHGSTPTSTATARSQIHHVQYDVALIASEEPEAFDLAQGIAVRVGFTTGTLRPFKNVWVRRRVTRAVSRRQHTGSVDAHEAEILYRLGASLVDAVAPSADPRVLRPMLVDEPVPQRAAAPVLLQAGAKWGASGVSDAALRAIADALAHHRGVRIVAGPTEVDAARAVLQRDVESFAHLRAWVAAIDACSTIVTPDTGAAHVAGMLGVPVLDVFPDAHFDAQVRRWRPWASPYRALRASAIHGGAVAAIVEAALDAF